MRKKDSMIYDLGETEYEGLGVRLKKRSGKKIVTEICSLIFQLTLNNSLI